MWPFSKPKPIIDKRDMNEDWKVGDLAQCVDDRWAERHADNPQKDDVLRVTKVADVIATNQPVRMFALFFEGQAAGYVCTYFRKLRPTIEPASDEFTTELKDRLGVNASTNSRGFSPSTDLAARTCGGASVRSASAFYSQTNHEALND